MTTKSPRSTIKQEDQDRVLDALETLAKTRRETIAEKLELGAMEDARHAEVKRQIQDGHRQANRSLVEAVDVAYEIGVSKWMIYERIGITGQMMGKIRASVSRQERLPEEEGDEQ
jgi:hypothetical protein